jgi:CPA2 family monovalent cation:H+ antiporter-2
VAQETALISTVAVGLGYAFVGGYAAVRVGLPPLVGYLLAGIAAGPFTPGFVGDVNLAQQLAEIGVILLMFGVGMHFSIGDLLAVRAVAVPGAIAQIVAATVLGYLLAWAWGWSFAAGIVFGLALSVASTVVLLRALEARGLLNTGDGRIAVGWLIVEDLVMVLVLVMLPALASLLGKEGADELSWMSILTSISWTLAMVGLFVVLMLFAGSRVFPWVLKKIEATGSTELFTLAVIALSLGVAYGSAILFGVTFALGAFFAGVVVHESDLSHRAADELRPLQDTFAALFFVSVGMLFDPAVLVQKPIEVLGVLGIIMIGKSLAALAIVLLLRRSINTAMTVSAALAQIGEFSFILASLGVSLKMLPREGQSLIVGGALLSITLNPLIFWLVGTFLPKPQPEGVTSRSGQPSKEEGVA